MKFAKILGKENVRIGFFGQEYTDNMGGFIYIWLQSEFVSKLIKAHSYGSVVTHIEKEHLSSIPIPLLKSQSAQREINTLDLSANEKRYEAYQLEQEALRVMDKEVIYAK